MLFYLSFITFNNINNSLYCQICINVRFLIKLNMYKYNNKVVGLNILKKKNTYSNITLNNYSSLLLT